MSQQVVDTGAAANDGTGDTLRAAFTKLNANDAELFATGGPPGPAGATGATGAAGATGATGATGADGLDGATGATGAAGAQGPQGVAGATGSQGPQGIQGDPGDDGAAGATGAQGIQGVTGSTGAAGAAGATGAQGLQGDPGADGSDGVDGAAGPQGDPGADGDDGAQGIQGVPGATGATGDTGAAGADGSPDTAAQVLAKLLTVDGSGSLLDADLLDGVSSSGYATTAALAAKLDSSSYTAADVRTKLLTVDGAGSLVDSDLLDGVEGADYGRISQLNTWLGSQLFNGPTLTITNAGGLTVNQTTAAAGASFYFNGKGTGINRCRYSSDAATAYFAIRDDSAAVDRLLITPLGAWGIGGLNVGTAGQTIISAGSGSSPVAWGVPTFPDGSATAPGIAFQSDLDTGLYRIAANQFGLAAGGALRIDVSATGAALNTGVRQGSGLKHQRVTTGSIAAGATALVTLTWTTAFSDASYTAIASVVDATTTSLSLSVVHVESITATEVTVRVLNNALGALTGVLQVIAMHD